MANNHTNRSVNIVDDDERGRNSVSLVVEDAGFTPVQVPGPLGTLAQFLRALGTTGDWMLFDHRLRHGTYAAFDGAEAVAMLYRKAPSLLCTDWASADLDAMRPFRGKIPVLIRSDELDIDAVVTGFDICVREFRGEYLPTRAPMQAVVRIEEIDLEQHPAIVKATVPGWNHQEVVRFPITVIPADLHKHVLADARFLAKVNLGAEDQSELYFENFEYRT